MVFVTGPLCSGKRTFAQKLGGRQVYDVQDLAADAADLNRLADELADYDVVTAAEVGGGVVPIDPAARAAREAAAVWPVCWPRERTALCRCFAVCRRF